MKLLLLATLVATCLAFRHVELEAKHQHQVPIYWRMADSQLADDHKIRFTFAVKLRNEKQLDIDFKQRSDPDHPLYMKWFTRDEITSKFGPEPAHLSKVAKFLKLHNFEYIEVVPHGFVIATATKATAESFMQTRLKLYESDHFKPLIRGAPGVSYGLPSEIAHVVDFVAGIKGQFPTPHHQARIETNPEIGFGVTPKVIHKQYGTNGVAGKAANNSQGFVELIGQHFAQSDVNEFFDIYGQGHKAPKYTVLGGANGGSVGIESALDSEYLPGSGVGIASTCWSIPASSQTPFLDWMVAMGKAKTVPVLFSISYGESEPGNSLSLLYRLDAEFKKTGLRGVSLLVAAGDSGVAASPGGCTKGQFDPDWPGTSPSITTVGGTQLNIIDTGKEKLWTEGGGGFSTVFPRPSYQDVAVPKYISTNKNLPPQGFWNASSRAYPDISALANGFWVVVNKVPTPGIGGTSCAAPTSGGVLALVNDYLMQNGANSSLGFLNPMIYKLGNDGFHDINSGKCNEGCDGVTGFCTQDGWDPASGWGSPYYPHLISKISAILGLSKE